MGAELLLKERVETSQEELLLKELAKIEGSPLEREILGKIPIATAPPPCRKRVLTKREVAGKIANYLRKNRVSVEEIAVKGANRIEVIRSCTLAGGERIKERISEYLKKNYPELVLISVPSPSIRIPYKNYQEKVELDSLGERYARFVYTITVNGKTVKKLWIPARIDKKVKVVVARAPIPKGLLIEPQMVEVKEVLSSKARGALSEVNEVVGKVAKKDFLPGEVIKERELSPNFVVKKGKPVKVVYEKGPIHIEILGIPLENGATGNIIRVKNISTGKVLRCRVEENGLVKYLSE
jgi:flagella basal body P-ring formation protein FlgA